MDTRTAKPPPKSPDAHYLSREHNAWRAAVIRRARGCCQWPGCGRREARMFADHIIELRDDPSKALDVDNGQLLCGSHHTMKTYRERLARNGGG